MVFSVCKEVPTANLSDPCISILNIFQEIGYTHMRIAEGVQSLLQMSGMLARLCKKSAEPNILAS